LDFWTQEKSFRRVGFVPEYVAVAGSVPAALLLSQLVYWFRPHHQHGKSKLTIHKDGKQWLAKSREELMKECGLTLTVTKGALDHLVSEGLVERAVHQFNRRTVTHLHLRIDELSKRMCDGRNPTSASVGITPLHRSESDHCITEADITSEITSEVADGTAEEDPISLPAKQAEEQPRCEVIPMPTVKQILEQHRERQQTKFYEKPAVIGPGWLATWWVKLQAETGKEFVKALTKKEVGQLKLLVTSVGGEKAREIIGFAIPHWSTVAFEVKEAYGLSTAPDQPVVGFLLKYHDVVWQLIAKKPTKPKMESITALQASKPAHIEAPEEKVTEEAVQAALAKLKQGG
jgi:DNA-binding MarR family transcriptional regulator